MTKDLVSDDADHVERRAGIDRVDDHVAMYADKMLRVEHAVFVLIKANAQVRTSDSSHMRLDWDEPTWPAVSMISVAYS